MLKIATLALALAVPPSPHPAPAPPDTWKIDVTHSELTFSVRHVLSRVRGQFTQWGGTIVADPKDWSKASVDVTIQTASISTNNERRDNHLRSGDFFDAERFPTMTFKSTKVERTKNDVRIAGDLTMHGVTKPVVLEGKFLGMTKNPKTGKVAAAFDASATIKRSEFGMTWNKVVEGGMLVSDEVAIDISVAADQQ